MFAAIYVVPSQVPPHDYMLDTLSMLIKKVRRVVVVTDADPGSPHWNAIGKLSPSAIIPFGDGMRSILNGYRAGLMHLREAIMDRDSPVMLTNGLMFGPFCELDRVEQLLDEDGFGLMASSFLATKMDARYSSADMPERLPYLDTVILSAPLLHNEAFWAFWDSVTISGDYQQELRDVAGGLARLVESVGLTVGYPFDVARYETSDPRLYEVEKLAAEPFSLGIINTAFLIDPLLSDIFAMNQRAALDTIRRRSPELYPGISRFLVRHIQLRDFHAVADQVEIVDEIARNPRTKRWSFGTVGVFIHAFYANMMPEFWALIERLPSNFHLYVTTATEENKTLIEAFLDEKGLAETAREVRVVEQNRGRDMGSLFISFRDIIIEERHEICLRLHSKRTPQVSRQVGESFKAHLFDNLVYTNGYVRNLYDLFEEQPDLGLIMPPTIHIGFGTLGHAWFNNREPLLAIAKDMGLHVPFDSHTPLAPYGTMYWFRSKALKRMFQWNWRWEQYNPEPMHVDGGLAHIQERLIPYVVQHAGYRVISIMNRKAAARNYAKLEYKMQRLASQLPIADVVGQFHYLQSQTIPRSVTLFDALVPLYQKHVMTRPIMLRVVRPFAKRVKAILMK